MVGRAPTQVSLTFSEKVAMSDDSVRVLDPKGKRVDTGKATDLGGTTYGVKLHSGLPDGTFTVTYQVVSADSHPVSGAFTFSVGAPSQTSVALSDPAVGGGVVGALYGVGRYVSYAGFILLVGGAAFVLACWQRGAGVRPVQRLVVSGWLALTGATLALLLLRGSYVGSGKVGDIFDLTLLGQVLQTKAGAALVSRLLLLAAGALFIAVLFGAYARRDEADATDEGDASGRSDASDKGTGPTRAVSMPMPRRGTSPSGSRSAAPSSRRAWRRAGRWPSTPPPVSRRASRCPWTCCTCWRSPSGWAACRRCSWRCSGRPPRHRSTRRPYGASRASRSAA